MAELIDKGVLKEMFPCNGEGSWTYNVTVKAYIDSLPTTTESEIRAKAIDEFAEELKAELSEQIFSDEEKFKYARKEQEAICAQNASWKVAIRLADYVAEQLKEE